jgi:hypothetical protein
MYKKFPIIALMIAALPLVTPAQALAQDFDSYYIAPHMPAQAIQDNDTNYVYVYPNAQYQHPVPNGQYQAYAPQVQNGQLYNHADPRSGSAYPYYQAYQPSYAPQQRTYRRGAETTLSEVMDMHAMDY